MDKTKMKKTLKTVGVVRERERERRLKTGLFICDAKNQKNAYSYLIEKAQNNRNLLNAKLGGKLGNVENTENRNTNNYINNKNKVNKISIVKRMNYINKIQEDPKTGNYSNKVENNPNGKKKEVFCKNSSSFLCVLYCQKRETTYVYVNKNSLKENKKYLIEDKDKYA